MAKSIRLEELQEIEQPGRPTVTQHFRNFAEQWFRAPFLARQPRRNLDERAIWEKAVHWEILAAEKNKY